MSKLSTYLSKAGLTQSAFAKQVGISHNYLSQIVSGARAPSLTLAYEIELATGGAVPMKCWVTSSKPGRKMSHTATQKASETTEADNGRIADGG